LLNVFFATGMPNFPYLYAVDFVETLKKKYAAGTYKEMVGAVTVVSAVLVHVTETLDFTHKFNNL